LSLIGKAASARVVYLTGDETALRNRALVELLQAHEIRTDDFDYESVDADSVLPEAWIGSVSTVPFMASRRVLVVRHVSRRDPKTYPVDLARVPEQGLLILVDDDESGDDGRQSTLDRVSKRWQDLVKTAKGTILNFAPDNKRAGALVGEAAAALGKPLTPKARDLLLEMCGGSASRAMDELEKLAIFAGDSPQIRESDVTALVVPSREWSIFKLTDALLADDVGAALKQLRNLVGSSSKPEEAAHRSIIPMVARQMKLLWQARTIIEAQSSLDRLTPELRHLLPDKPNIATLSEYQSGPLMRAARNLNFKRLERAMAIVADTDARLKGALPAFSAIETLERMALELCTTFRGARTVAR